MIKSKEWNWATDINDYWRNVADEFVPVALKWKNKQLTNRFHSLFGLYPQGTNSLNQLLTPILSSQYSQFLRV